MRAVTIDVEGTVRRLRGAALVETTEAVLRADEIDYDEKTGFAEARGNVQYESFTSGEKLFADRGEYNVNEETGKFYGLRGSAPAKIEARPGVLTTSNPFYFEGKWAEKLKDRYILYDGMLTDCLLPKPWWTLRAPKFDVIPGDRALAYRSVFRLKGIPLLYAPAFYKSLKKMPRKSGLLTPSIGNSNRRGPMIGGGYYWAINRSYDLMYRGQLFTRRGVAHNADFRGRPTATSDFWVAVYGVSDRGITINDQLFKAPGYQVTGRGKADLKGGFQALADINFLSSFDFRQQFTESFQEAIFSETKSVALLTKHWSSFAFNGVFERWENFQSTQPDDKILIRKLPELQFLSRPRQFRDWPVWFEFSSAAGLLRRSQLEFQTRRFVERLDVEPRVTTAFRWRQFALIPSFAFRGTYYGSSLDGPLAAGERSPPVTGDNIVRAARDLSVRLELPALAKVMRAPRWIGSQMKHVIETRANYRYITGINNFNRLVRFDETELLSNTNEVEVAVTNRLYAKSKGGTVTEFLSWDLAWKRYFDPTFGGALVPGQRNVLLTSTDLTGFAFLDRYRNYSPIVSVLRVQAAVGMEWRTDFDPLQRRFVNSSISVDGRLSNYFISLGHVQVRNSPILAPSSNQFRGLIGIGQENRRGWNGAFLADYDYRQSTLRFAQWQVTFNTDCCGFSVQYRRFNFGNRFENQFRVALAIANIGSFGTLRRQERIF